MNATLAEQLICLGVYALSAPGVANGHLAEIYQNCTGDEAKVIHSALCSILRELNRLAAKDDYKFVRHANTFASLINNPVPGLATQPYISSKRDEIQRLIQSLEEDHPAWAEMLQNFDYDARGIYINNVEAVTRLCSHLPQNFSNTRKKDFLRTLGNGLTAQFIAELSDKYNLDEPVFPYDWSKNVYYLIGLHIATPSPDILNARTDIWKTLFSLSKFEF